ncbi:hypothetical protein FHT86_005580 [Rhizobium sp. BK313]|uniref:Imm42 family immunity protein n=1 Tax=Rhizobium sp. BK313 TaxID=2587081 RepID=UPI00105E521C|nr:Imm42 family immunity protein [Rhizobium sp. BK313]MBB3457262.1 hypothetical protein [Rhizobium sp. BK313]
MDFGDRTRFGITLELDANYGGPRLFGRFCYWMEGNVVGNYDDVTSLADLVVNMKYIIGDRGKRLCPALLDMPPAEAFRIISEALDGTSDEILQYVAEGFMPARFDICIPVDVFDCWRIFLVEGTREARLFFFNLDVSQLSTMTLAAGEADEVFGAAYSHLDNLYESVVVGVQGSASDAKI